MIGKRAKSQTSSAYGGSPVRYMHSVGLDCDQLRHILHCLTYCSGLGHKPIKNPLLDKEVNFLIDLLEGYIGPQEYVIKRGSISVEVPKNVRARTK